MANRSALKISKAGYDVERVGDQYLLFNSDYPMLKIHKQGFGKVVCTIAEPIQSVDIPHDLGIIPMYFAFTEALDASINRLDGFYQMPYTLYVGLGQTIGLRPLMDEAKLTLEFSFPGGFLAGDTEINFYYYIFEDPIVDISVYG